MGTTYKGLPHDVRAGDRILIDDGKVALRVVEVAGRRVVTRVEVGGPVSNHKGLNLPGVAVSVPALSDKDEADLRWALHLRADLIALSFVRSASDIDGVPKIMDEEGVRLPVIAKIEKPQAVDNLEEIVGAFDGIMVARGDLGVELPLEQVPMVQKRAVEMARRGGQAGDRGHPGARVDDQPAAPDPRRGLGLRERRARRRGRDHAVRRDQRGPVPAGGGPHDGPDHRDHRGPGAGTDRAAGDPALHQGRCHHLRGGRRWASCWTCVPGGVHPSGDSARRMSRLRSRIPLLAFTPHAEARSQLALSWGTETFLTALVHHTDEMVKQVDEALLSIGRCEVGDLVVIVAGSPPGIPGSLNAMRVHRMGDAVGRVVRGYH